MAFDRNDPAQVTALRNRILTDPDLSPFTTPAWDLGEIEQAINLKRAAYQVDKPSIMSEDIRAFCTYAAYNNLAIDEQEWIRWITSSEEVRVTSDLKQQVAGVPTASQSIWAPADRDAMNAAMVALITFDGSIAEDEFGYGTIINLGDIAAARDSA